MSIKIINAPLEKPHESTLSWNTETKTKKETGKQSHVATINQIPKYISAKYKIYDVQEIVLVMLIVRIKWVELQNIHTCPILIIKLQKRNTCQKIKKWLYELCTIISFFGWNCNQWSKHRLKVKLKALNHSHGLMHLQWNGDYKEENTVINFCSFYIGEIKARCS